MTRATLALPRHPARRRLGVPAGALLAAALVLSAGSAAAAGPGDDPGFRRFEVTAGLGGAGSQEKDIFNVPVDAPSTPDLLLDFRLRQNVTERLAIGFHVYGNTERTAEYVATDTSGIILGTFRYRLTVLHVGFDGRYLFLAPPFQPFIELGINYVSGTVDSRDFGSLQLNGVSVGGGPGIQYRFRPALTVGAQGLFAVGTSKWDQVPFPGLSQGRDFNPGFAGAEGFVTWRWGLARR